MPRRLPRQEAQDATERPSYARLQWLPNLSADFVRQFGVDSTPAWTAQLARVSVTLGDCSGTIVSRDGLVVTSAACLDSALTSAGQSALPDDVVLAAPGSEMPLAGLTVRLLVEAADVTADVQALLSSDPTLTETAASVRIADSLRTAGADVDLSVIATSDSTFGAYRYRSIEDVRLVFLPESEARDFGGHFDAGSFPQYKFNVAFLRLFADDMPVETPTFARWGSREPRIGAPVFAAGIAAIGASGADEEQLAPAVSGGRIRGFNYDATEAPAIASVYGLYDRYYSFGPTSEWELSDRWLNARQNLPGHQAISMASTTEIHTGMLGGGLFSLDLRYQGTMYDRNDEAAIDMPARRRAIAVPATATLLLLETVYDAEALRTELANGSMPESAN